ncbi:hypothetical protein DEJ48_16090 [Streptomyces venezuelae]|uniref:Uncharacterized protein n=1 Tax=Streptomyces venezuelae TaxID=54571 RepID=A0A5P2BW54_STRVZ|nr:barstar family protein [Streptomyces venezuelae]QES34722.1 hypothetical protein DEJ48_16090 [Streptomyces venezuelae]
MQHSKYALAAYDPEAAPYDEIWALCADARHLFADQLPDRTGLYEERDAPSDALTEPPVRLLGCAPRGVLKDALESGRGDLGHGRVLRLARSGRPLQHAVEGEVVAWVPSARGRGLVDLALDPWTARPPRAAGMVWDAWWSGWPTEPNVWARDGTGTDGRSHWLTVARRHAGRPDPDRPDRAPGTAYHLDGRHITDESAFYCALGEAVHGPGGYAGRSPETLADCLRATEDRLRTTEDRLRAPKDCPRGTTNAPPPPTLVWHTAHKARTCLGVTPVTSRTDDRAPTFEELLALLRQMDIQVVLA